MLNQDKTKQIIRKYYSQIAVNNASCCGNKIENEKIAQSIGYSKEEIKSAGIANLGLGCGNPTALAKIKEGETVLDLGSGAGFDCFLVAKKVGKTGRVIGVDLSKEMVKKAQVNAKKQDYNNVEFKLGDIENLPIKDNFIDVVISNCVINLAPNKLKVFEEIYRVLKKDGRMYISDIVLLDNLTKKQKEKEELIVGCVGGALLKDDYLKVIKEAGFKVKILFEDKDISKRQYQGIPLESLKVEAQK